MKSKEQIEHENQVARSFDILLIAERMGYTFKCSGKHYVCNEKKEMVIFKDTNSFYDYYNKVGGTPIDFVMQENNCSVKDAIMLINEMAGNTYIPEINVKKENKEIKEKIIKLPERNDNHKRVYAYLKLTRGISQEVISYCLHNHLLYESKDKHNAVFLGKDINGNVKHAFIRGTITGVQYRGDVYGSNKDYGFSIEGNNDELIVFEAPIDLLSYMSLYPDNQAHLVALGMVVDTPIYTYLKEHNDIKKVALVLDNDAPGIDAAKKIAEKLNENGITVIGNEVNEMMKKNNCKDVNELLCKGNCNNLNINKGSSR